VVKRKITAELAVIFLEMVDLIGIEPTTLRMRTVRSPKADILHPNAFDSLNFCTVLLNSVSVYPENVIQAIQHPPRALFKKIHVSIIFLVKSAAIIVVCPRLRPEM
jgi:hypothetical protein